MDTKAEDSGEPLKSGSAVEERQSAISNSQSQLDLLTDLSRRLQTLRQFPGSLLRSEHALGENQVLQGPLSSTLKGSFTKYVEDLKALHVAVVEEKVQDVLRIAAESEQRDGAGIKYTREKETQKRRCVFLHSFFFPPPPSTHDQSVAASSSILNSFLVQTFPNPRVSKAIPCLPAQGLKPIPSTCSR